MDTIQVNRMKRKYVSYHLHHQQIKYKKKSVTTFCFSEMAFR